MWSAPQTVIGGSLGLCDPKDTGSCVLQQTFLGPYCPGLPGHRQGMDTALTEEMREVLGLAISYPS